MGQVPEKVNGEQVDAPNDWNKISEEFTLQDAINNEYAVRIAQNEFENNLASLNYDGGFYIIWSDQDKIQVGSHIDDFEDGDYTNDPSWTEAFSNGSATVQTATVKNGSNALELTSGGSGGDECLNYQNSRTLNGENVFKCWIRPTETGNGRKGIKVDTDGASPLDGKAESAAYLNNNGDLVLRTTDDTGSFIAYNSSTFNYSADTWYQIELKVDPSNSQAKAILYDSSGNQKASVGYQSASSKKEVDYTQVFATYGSSITAYFDDVWYSSKTLAKKKTNVNITTGTGGDVKLSRLYPTDGMEDGSSEMGFESDSNTTIDANSEIDGTYTVQHNSNSAYNSVGASTVKDVTEDGYKLKFKVKIDNNAGNTGDKVRFRPNAGGGSGRIFVLTFTHGGNVEVQPDGGGSPEQFFSSWSANTVYEVTATVDFTNQTYDMTINGTTKTGISFRDSPSKYGHFSIINDTNNTGANVNVFLDEISYKGSEYVSNGSVTSTQFDLSNDLSGDPNTVVLSQTVDLPSGTDIDYTLTDANGNTKTLQQSDVDTEVDVSNFTSQKVDCKIELYADTAQDSTPTHEDVSAHFKV